jgi:hypothetical protein
MGRMRIKKKEIVIPFRETIVYRLLLLIPSIIMFFVGIYQMMIGFQADNVVALVAFGAIALMAAISSFYNLDRMKYARVPPRKGRR